MFDTKIGSQIIGLCCYHHKYFDHTDHVMSVPMCAYNTSQGWVSNHIRGFLTHVLQLSSCREVGGGSMGDRGNPLLRGSLTSLWRTVSGCCVFAVEHEGDEDTLPPVFFKRLLEHSLHRGLRGYASQPVPGSASVLPSFWRISDTCSTRPRRLRPQPSTVSA